MSFDVGNSAEFCLLPKDMQKLDDLFHKLKIKKEKFMGYQVNHAFDYSELYRFLGFSINNVGDPFMESNYGVNTKEFEREVLDFFADLMHIRKEDFWGYVTNGGTAGNMFSLYLARELYPDGMVYFSKDTHYSIPKSVRVCNMEYRIIDSQPNGEIDYLDLEKQLQENRNRPAIIVANIGTTMTGAVDKVSKIHQILESNSLKKFHIHCDAAMGGMLLPFLEDAPQFDFRLPISSMAISGHKMIGAPVPCGIVLTKKELVQRIEKPIEYIVAVDNTLSGSRNGLSPLFLWYAVKKLGNKGFKALAKRSVRNANYALSKFKEIGWDAWINPNANVVVLKRPSEELVKKWQLAVYGEIAHIYAMGHVSEKMIDEFVSDLQKTA